MSDETPAQPSEQLDPRIEFFQFGFSCCIAAICKSFDLIIEDNDEIILKEIHDRGRVTDAKKVEEVYKRVKSSASLFRDLMLAGRFPFEDEVIEIRARAEAALHVGIEAVMAMEDED